MTNLETTGMIVDSDEAMDIFRKSTFGDKKLNLTDHNGYETNKDEKILAYNEKLSLRRLTVHFNEGIFSGMNVQLLFNNSDAHEVAKRLGLQIRSIHGPGTPVYEYELQAMPQKYGHTDLNKVKISLLFRE